MQSTNADGVNVGINNEAAAGQIIFRAHAHVFPRYNNDGLKDWVRTAEYGDGEAHAMGERIRANLA